MQQLKSDLPSCVLFRAPWFQAAPYRLVLLADFFRRCLLPSVSPTMPASEGLWRSTKPTKTSPCAMHFHLTTEVLFKSRRVQFWSHFWCHGSSSQSHPVVSPSWPTAALLLHRLRRQSMLASSCTLSDHGAPPPAALGVPLLPDARGLGLGCLADQMMKMSA